MSISLLFDYPLSPILGAKPERRQSEGRTKAERKRSVCRAVIIKRKKQGATFEKMDVKTD